MKFANIYISGNPKAGPAACLKLEDGLAPLYLLIPESPGVTDPDSGVPLPLGCMKNGKNNLEHLTEWCDALNSQDSGLLEMTERLDPEKSRFAPPVLQPASFRDFYAFEEHVRTARQRRNLEVPPEWYQIPVFYFSNHNSMITHGDPLPFPAGGEWLDFELEAAAVITRKGKDLSAEEAESHIGGYCLLNDWSLRDAQRQEMAVGLGPAKGKDFATGIGPWLVTPDELEQYRTGKGFDLKMTAAVNGELLSKGNWKSIHYSFAQMLERASQNVMLKPGDIIGSGTVGTGCILELGPENAGGWLKRGDVVTLEIDTLGSMENKIT